ncbi:hypothetical protein GCM10010350_74620 [Streptomyces galilaeus]|nr:hypothetical protein GCM10010350_74620 [Streptomyces galilaeus]
MTGRQPDGVESGSCGGSVLPEVTLLAEWPVRAEVPTDSWLSNLPADTRVAEPVRLAKIRWRIEHDYRELKHSLGLDHFEGRSWNGWHHHVTLVTAAHAFLTEQRLAPKADTATVDGVRIPGPAAAAATHSPDDGIKTTHRMITLLQLIPLGRSTC